MLSVRGVLTARSFFRILMREQKKLISAVASEIGSLFVGFGDYNNCIFLPLTVEIGELLRILQRCVTHFLGKPLKEVGDVVQTLSFAFFFKI